MSDNEIIKALECHVGKMDCDSCPYGAEHGVYCIKVLHRHSLEIITRQKAEIERYKQCLPYLEHQSVDFCGIPCDFMEGIVEKAKAEAIKDFAERLKESVEYIPWCDYPPVQRCIDDLVEKMEREREWQKAKGAWICCRGRQLWKCQSIARTARLNTASIT